MYSKEQATPAPTADAAGNCKPPEIALAGTSKAGSNTKIACASLVEFACIDVFCGGYVKTVCHGSALCHNGF